MQGCFAEPEWRHGGLPRFPPPLAAFPVPFYGLSSCKRRPFTVRKAVNRNAKSRLQRCKRRSFASLSAVFSVFFSSDLCTHSWQNAVKSIINDIYVCTRITDIFSSSGAFLQSDDLLTRQRKSKRKSFPVRSYRESTGVFRYSQQHDSFATLTPGVKGQMPCRAMSFNFRRP